jgi:hypothetical protein
MIDPLLARALLAAEEGRAIRDEHRLLMLEQDKIREKLRRTVSESANAVAEIRASRTR